MKCYWGVNRAHVTPLLDYPEKKGFISILCILLFMRLQTQPALLLQLDTNAQCHKTGYDIIDHLRQSLLLKDASQHVQFFSNLENK